MNENYAIKKIRHLMDDRGVTVQQLADALNISQFVVYHWFDRNTKSFMPLIGDIAKYFNVSMDYLMGNVIDPQVNKEADECLAELKSRAELRELFKAAKGASKSDVIAATRVIETLKQREE